MTCIHTILALLSTQIQGLSSWWWEDWCIHQLFVKSLVLKWLQKVFLLKTLKRKKVYVKLTVVTQVQKQNEGAARFFLSGGDTFLEYTTYVYIYIYIIYMYVMSLISYSLKNK